MIEVLFADSEAASMKAAKSTILITKSDGPTALFLTGKRKPPKKDHFGWIEGTTHEVFCLNFMLDIGDLKETIDSTYRKELIYSMYSQNQWGKDDQMESELRKLPDLCLKEMTRLTRNLENGEAIRIWYSDAPYSLCGFYHLCHILCKFKSEVHVVKLPEHLCHSNSIVSYHSWGDVAAEEFAGFLQYEKELSRNELRMYAAMWNELTEDNSPLRAVINGKVIGVPEDFYDFLIWKRITATPIKEARLIGDIMGNYPINIGDWWYAKRIDCLILQGIIKVIEDSDSKYARTICLA